MTLRMRDVEIENVNRYPEPVVGGLRQALDGGVAVVPDPKRSNFFEVRGPAQTYYIDVLPGGHKVILLSVWPTVN